MGRLSAYPLDAVEVSSLYPSTFMIYRARRTLTDYGQTPLTWWLNDTKPGRVRELNAHERLRNDVRKAKLTHKCYGPPSTDLERNDVVIVYPKLPLGIDTFLVVQAHIPGNIQHHYEAMAKTIVSGSKKWAGYMV